MRAISLLITISFISLFMPSCKVFEGEVGIPAYLYIEPFMFDTSASALITDVWVFQDNAIRGTFALPAKIPLQKTGRSVINLQGGIIQSGQFEERMPYLMYTSFFDTIDLKPLQVDTIRSPHIAYLPNVKFDLNENFESSGFAFEYNPRFKNPGDTVLAKAVPGMAKNSKYSGLCSLSPSSDIFEIYSKVFNNFLGYGNPVYFEFDYYGNIPFTVGLYATNISTGEVKQFSVISVATKDSWNKIYLDITNELSTNIANGSTNFRVFFLFDRRNGNGQDPYLYLDNIKLLHLE